MAGDGKGTRSEKDPQSLVADLLRRVTTPEVLAGVAGAAAAAHFTKHMVEESDETEAEGQPQETDEAQAADEDEREDDAQEEVDQEDPRAATDEDEPEEDEAEEDASEEPDEPDAGSERDDPEAGDGEQEEPRAAENAPEDVDEAEPDDDDQREPLQDEGDESDEPEDSNGSLAADDERMQLLDRARRYAEELTGHPVEGFSSVEQEDRGWRVGVEVVELSRVPSTTDVLGSYELVLTEDGDFVDFRRANRYYRNSTEDA
jgi:gas vesicle protein GvpO